MPGKSIEFEKPIRVVDSVQFDSGGKVSAYQHARLLPSMPPEKQIEVSRWVLTKVKRIVENDRQQIDDPFVRSSLRSLIRANQDRLVVAELILGLDFSIDDLKRFEVYQLLVMLIKRGKTKQDIWNHFFNQNPGLDLVAITDRHIVALLISFIKNGMSYSVAQLVQSVDFEVTPHPSISLIYFQGVLKELVESGDVRYIELVLDKIQNHLTSLSLLPILEQIVTKVYSDDQQEEYDLSTRQRLEVILESLKLPAYALAGDYVFNLLRTLILLGQRRLAKTLLRNAINGQDLKQKLDPDVGVVIAESSLVETLADAEKWEVFKTFKPDSVTEKRWRYLFEVECARSVPFPQGLPISSDEWWALDRAAEDPRLQMEKSVGMG